MPKAKTNNQAELANRAAQSTNADIYLYNGPIRDAGFSKVIAAVSPPTNVSRAILLITTFGGDAAAAYRIARWFQRFYKEFILCPTSVCASAGTLLAIGANKLYMSPFSELGPLDVQLAKKNEIGERESGLVTQAALENLQQQAFDFWEHFMLQVKARSFGNISFEKCAEIASDVCGCVFSEVFSQLDPGALGQNARDMQVAVEYGTRLAKRGKNISAANIEHLVSHYPSHDFVINLEEAADLFEDVNVPPTEIGQLIVALGKKAMVPEADIRSLLVSRLATAPKSEESENVTRRKHDEPSSRAA
jgi:hypothetical protein